MVIRIFNDPDLRMQSGEGVGGDLRTRARNGGEQSGLAGVRVTDETDLGHDAEFEEELAFVAGLARLSEAGRLAASRREIAVAQSAAAAFAQGELLPVCRQIRYQVALGARAGRDDRLFGQINLNRPGRTRMANSRPHARAYGKKLVI